MKTIIRAKNGLSSCGEMDIGSVLFKNNYLWWCCSCSIFELDLIARELTAPLLSSGLFPLVYHREGALAYRKFIF